MAILATTTVSQLRSSFVRIDTEFFKPQLAEASRLIESIPNVMRLGSICERITQGANPKFTDSGFPSVNGKNVYFGTMTEGDPNYVSAAEFHRLSSYLLRRNDLVITLKHASKVGRVWIVEDDEPRIYSRNIGLIRLRHNSPIRHSVLLLYLWTKYGQLLLDRCATGGTTGQITLPMSELGRIPIPPIAIEEQEEIDATFWNARSLERVAIDKYQEAKNALEATLGIDEEFIQSATGYLTHLSEIITDGRADADYFQPQFRHIHEQLDTHDTVALQKLAEISKGIEVGSSAYRDTGRLFLRVSNIKEMEIEATASDKYISDSLYQTLHLFRPSIGDILLTKDGSPGICMVVDNVVDGIISGGVVRLKLRDASVPAEYLALAINSRACRMQVEQECSGAVILHWKPSSIRKLRIPLLADEEMASIAKLVSESKQAKRESFRLLYEARDRVEQLIEEAIQ